MLASIISGMCTYYTTTTACFPFLPAFCSFFWLRTRRMLAFYLAHCGLSFLISVRRLYYYVLFHSNVWGFIAFLIFAFGLACCVFVFRTRYTRNFSSFTP